MWARAGSGGAALMGRAWQCHGSRADGYRCEQRTTDPSGLCGQCSGKPAPATPPPGTLRPSPPANPLREADLVRTARDEHARAPELIAAARETQDRVTMGWLAANPAAPGEALALVAAASVGDWPADVETRVAVAAHRNASPETLAVLADDEEVKVRLKVATNRRTPPGVLGRLAGDRKAVIAVCIARRMDCPAEVLGRLAADQRAGVREAALKHPDCPGHGKAAAGLLAD